MRGISLGAVVVVAMAALAGGCRRDPGREADAVDKSVTSWEATMDLLDEQAEAGAVPPRFVRETLKAARAGCDRVEADLAKAAGDPRAGELRRRVDRLRDRVSAGSSARGGRA